MNKQLIAIVIVILAILGFAAWKLMAPQPWPAAAPETEDTTGAIMQSLDTVDLGNLDAEFQQIDQDLNSF